MKSTPLEDLLNELHLHGGALVRLADCDAKGAAEAADADRLYAGTKDDRRAFILQHRRHMTPAEQACIGMFEQLVDQYQILSLPRCVQLAWAEGRRLKHGS